MSLIVAVPCGDGLVLASDSRGVLGTEARDGRPKLTLTGSFAFGLAGVTHAEQADETVFDPEAVALQYWAEADYRLSPARFDDFRDTLLAYARAAPIEWNFGRSRLACLVASVPEPGVALLGGCRVYGDVGGSEARVTSEFTRWGPETPWNLRMIGRWAEAQPLVGPLAARYQFAGRKVGEVPAVLAAAYAVDVLLTAADADPLVGGAFGVTLLRAPGLPSSEAVLGALTTGGTSP